MHPFSHGHVASKRPQALVSTSTEREADGFLMTVVTERVVPDSTLRKGHTLMDWQRLAAVDRGTDLQD